MTKSTNTLSRGRRSARLPSTRDTLALMLFMLVSSLGFHWGHFFHEKIMQIQGSDISLDNQLDQPVRLSPQVESSRQSQSSIDTARTNRFQEPPFQKYPRQIPQDDLHRPSQEVVLDNYAAAARRKGSSLRLDWTNLPPQSKLGQRMERIQSQCLLYQDHSYIPQEAVAFAPQPSGLGSALHTWMRGLCHATEHNKILLTRKGRFQWNDQALCPDSMKAQQNQLSLDRRIPFVNSNNNNTASVRNKLPDMSALWCYFGHHESGLRCPSNSINTTYLPPDKPKWIDYRCRGILKEYGVGGMSMGAAEWLFQNVSTLVIEEAERQIAQAFASFSDRHDRQSMDGADKTVHNMPVPASLITVHIRWGDKRREMTLQPIEVYVNATLALMTPEEKAGENGVHIYLTTEDPTAVGQFRSSLATALPPLHITSSQTTTNSASIIASIPRWFLYTSGPTNPTSEFKMTNAAVQSGGKAGLQSMGALLVSLQSNRYVLTGRSNWSRLINELRQSVIDARCGNCTSMIDVSAKSQIATTRVAHYSN